ncbi:RbtT/DalT/CsbX family MFS transporter [Nesterenkonia aerolata]|uniref:RbtT/DalT/CsbX family MFS transporter n=1 Tax=Nesterenkonia aerolata TaxID=3074079 RepID=A0ABU2DPW4_9MICC|nr:RbtT/DalT/CsbX family MFS transporter [Nesterenkonia sp. LY-0111]MDR8018355.1 RbtT/DalT/CsbX family MFS transporter [Nesterenkonia sp. LY-0111]
MNSSTSETSAAPQSASRLPLPVGHPEETRLDRLGIPSALKWGFLGLLVLMTGVGVESNILTPHMVAVLGSPEATAASIITGHSIAVAIGSYLGGALSDLFGPKRIMALGAGIFLVFQVLFLIALSSGSVEFAAVTYFLRGFGFPLFAFAFIVWVNISAPPQRRSTAIGWFYVMFTGGLPTLGSLVAIGAIPALGGGGAGGVGETRAMWMAGLLVLAGFLIAALGVKDPRGTERLAPAGESAAQVLTAGLRLTFTHRKVAMGFLIRLINTAPQFGMFIVMPVVIADTLGWGQGRWLAMTVAVYATNILVNAVFGAIGDRWGWRRTVQWFGITGSAIGLLAWWYVPQLVPAGSDWGFLLATAAGCMFGCLLAGFVPMGAIMPALAPDHRGAAMAMYTTAAGGAIFLGSAVVAVVFTIAQSIGISDYARNSLTVWVFVGLYFCAFLMIRHLKVPEDAAKEKYGKLFGRREISIEEEEQVIRQVQAHPEPGDHR